MQQRLLSYGHFLQVGAAASGKEPTNRRNKDKSPLLALYPILDAPNERVANLVRLAFHDGHQRLFARGTEIWGEKKRQNTSCEGMYSTGISIYIYIYVRFRQ